MFRPSVERWRAAAEAIAPDLPAAWILGVIDRESRGKPGAKGGTGDYGLMQCKPVVLAGYNDSTPGDPVTMAELVGQTERDGWQQIKVGSWYLRKCANRIHLLGRGRFPWPGEPPTDDQIRYSDLCYSAGVGGFLGYRAHELAGGAPDTFEGLAARAPGSGKFQIPARKFGHARAVLSLTRTDGASESWRPGARLPDPRPPAPRPFPVLPGPAPMVPSPEPWNPTPAPSSPRSPSSPSSGVDSGLAFGVLALAALWWFSNRRGIVSGDESAEAE